MKEEDNSSQKLSGVLLEIKMKRGFKVCLSNISRPSLEWEISSYLCLTIVNIYAYRDGWCSIQVRVMS